MKNTRTTVIGAIAAFSLLAVLSVGLIVGYFFSQVSELRTAPESTNANSPVRAQSSPSPPENELPIFSEMMQTGNTSADGTEKEAPFASRIGTIVFRLFLSVILAAILAFRPRKNVPLFGRNLYVAQTQILLAVVAAALMMVVGDNAARAFAIFAAVSLVRFRTNIRDPKEITVLLISLALGLAAGVGRWDLGVTLCLFALILLQVLERNEPEHVSRPMELTVKTRDTDRTQQILKGIFANYKIEAEVRRINPVDDDQPVGSIMYYLNLRLSTGTDEVSEKMLELDPENIEGIEWAQKKSAANIYQ